jgi:creatinine amidohydrolase
LCSESATAPSAKPLAARRQGQPSTIKQLDDKLNHINMKTLICLVSLILVGTITEAQIYYVQDMSTVEIAALDREKTIVILPGGILEQHGPYLPSFTDGYMNQALTMEIANAITKRPGWKALIFPLIPLGSGGANEIGRKYNFSGTYAIRHTILRSIFMDWGSELGDQGFKNIFVVHMHGAPNHNQAIDQASDYFSETYKGKMVNIWNLAFSYNEEFLNEKEQKENGFTVHAGIEETSVLYFLKPDLKTIGYKDAPLITAGSPEDLVTLAKKNDWPGYFGSPRLANLNLGEKYWKGWINYIIKQVENILDSKYDFNNPTYYQIMSNHPVFKLINEDAKNFDKQKETKQNAWLKSKGFE